MFKLPLNSVCCTPESLTRLFGQLGKSMLTKLEPESLSVVITSGDGIPIIKQRDCLWRVSCVATAWLLLPKEGGIPEHLQDRAVMVTGFSSLVFIGKGSLMKTIWKKGLLVRMTHGELVSSSPQTAPGRPLPPQCHRRPTWTSDTSRSHLYQLTPFNSLITDKPIKRLSSL